MSYDLGVYAKAEGTDKYVLIKAPECKNPTYNLRSMFVACMEWEYTADEHYPAAFVMDNVSNGIVELVNNRKMYEGYDSPNGWGTLDDAVKVLMSIEECIYECSREYPVECLYFSWS